MIAPADDAGRPVARGQRPIVCKSAGTWDRPLRRHTAMPYNGQYMRVIALPEFLARARRLDYER